jgi:hypothetical protein
VEVIGEDGIIYTTTEGDIMGDVMGLDDEDYLSGEEEGGEIIGYGDDGSPIVVGARHRRRARRRRHGGGLIKVQKPKWRASQVAPGVIAPDQGLLPLPMQGQPSNTFSAAVQNITFQGQIQKPFRGERLLVSTVRTGATAVGIILGQLFVGTDLNQLDVTQFDVEQVGAPNAFGVRLALKPAQPGVFIRLVCGLSAAVGGADTIFCSVTLLGRGVH